MHAVCEFTDDGAVFNVAQSELEALNEVGTQKYGSPLLGLPIGKAGVLLAAFSLITTGPNTQVEVDGQIAASATTDGQEVVDNAIDKLVAPQFNEQVGIAIKESGRLVVRVFTNEALDRPGAEPAETFEILSNARKNAQAVVDSLEPPTAG